MKFHLVRLTSPKPISQSKLLHAIRRRLESVPGAEVVKLGPGAFRVWELELQLTESDEPSGCRVYAGKKRRPKGAVTSLLPSYVVMRKDRVYMATPERFEGWKGNLDHNKVITTIGQAPLNIPGFEWDFSSACSFFRRLPGDLLVTEMKAIGRTSDNHMAGILDPRRAPVSHLSAKVWHGGKMGLPLEELKAYVPQNMKPFAVTFNVGDSKNSDQGKNVKINRIGLVDGKVIGEGSTCDVHIFPGASRSDLLRLALFFEKLMDAMYSPSTRSFMQYVRL